MNGITAKICIILIRIYELLKFVPKNSFEYWIYWMYCIIYMAYTLYIVHCTTCRWTHIFVSYFILTLLTFRNCLQFAMQRLFILVCFRCLMAARTISCIFVTHSVRSAYCEMVNGQCWCMLWPAYLCRIQELQQQ